MTSIKPTAPASTADATFTLTRTFDAPRALVFAAWTEADRLVRWFVPKGGFTLRVERLDVRPGGVFHYLMTGPNGLELWGRFDFREVAPPGRLVYVQSFSDPQGGVTSNPMTPHWPLRTLSTVTFEERDNRTTLTLTATPLDASEAEVRAFLAGHQSMRGGWGGTLDHLAAYLASPGESAGADDEASAGVTGREIIISRLIDAPRELVWKVWTTREHVEKWWGPDGFTTTTHEFDLRPGGRWRFTMHGPDGTNFPNVATFEVVEPPARLVYRHGGAVDGGEVPVVFVATNTFDDVGGRTRVTMRSVFPSVEALEKVVKEYGAIEGGKQHLARLAAYVAAMQ